MDKNITAKNVSSLEKVLCNSYDSVSEYNTGSCLKKERFSYQVAYTANANNVYANVCVKTGINAKINIYDVDFTAVAMPAFADENDDFHTTDDYYITKSSAVIPDILTPNNGSIIATKGIAKSLWITVETTEETEAGYYDIKTVFEHADKTIVETTFNIEIIPAVLPPQKLKFTQWLHCDCLASYYNIEPLCDKHWEIIENFASLAAKNGINTLLTPIFTPPLDTAEGSERPTIQLVDVTEENGKYKFGFRKLKRWTEMCRRCGIKYLEISHLFTQWGAYHTPKILVAQNGNTIKKFGWHTDSLSYDYKFFLTSLMKELTEFLKNEWDSKNVFFHISDEPTERSAERYGEIYRFVKPLLADFEIIEAISHYDMYKKGYIQTPICTLLTIDEFIKNNVNNLWAYNCCGEGKRNLSNRYIAMPSERNRIIGLQLYKYNIKGFLHWGYNFYYSALSKKQINPYVSNDADSCFPAGDPFSVYPGKDDALPSLRLFVFYDALQDIRAAELAERIAGRDKVMKIIERCGEITFSEYPHNPDYLLGTRSKINELIKNELQERKAIQ